MRPWMIVLTSAVLALVAVAAMIRPELRALPHSAVVPSLMLLSPTLALVALAVYALCAILLTSGDLVADALRTRLALAGNSAWLGSEYSDRMAALAHSDYRRLLPALAAIQPGEAADGTVLRRGPFHPHLARREVARLFYIAGARTHFFSALVVLAAGVVLGLAQTRAPLPFVPGPIPTVPAALAVAGLVLVAVLARIAVDVAAEPLLETILRLPVEPTEIGWMHDASEPLAAAPAADPLSAAAAPAMLAQITDRLGDVLERGHIALIEAVERLSATTEGLAQTTRSSIEALEAASRDRHEQLSGQPRAAEVAAITDLRDALTTLTEVLQRSRTAPAPEPDQPDRESGAASAGSREPDLALELHKLLQELETTR